jgi:hypothetical protein
MSNQKQPRKAHFEVIDYPILNPPKADTFPSLCLQRYCLHCFSLSIVRICWYSCSIDSFCMPSSIDFLFPNVSLFVEGPLIPKFTIF